jgi:amino acid adenylation domain-containing protein
MDTNSGEHRPRQAGGPINLVDLILRSADAHGARPAVSDGTTVLTYADLRARAERIAHGLRAQGVRPGDAVGVLMERGTDAFMAIVATLFSGAAYVAVDPRYPAARRAQMLQAAEVQVIVADPSSLEGVRSLLGETPIASVADLETGGSFADQATLPGVEAGDRASILFTSGTTGVPKGVELTHRGLVNFATNPALPRIVPTDRIGQVSSISFDAVHYELWCAFAAGAEVVVMPSFADMLGVDPGREIRRRAISVMLVPTMAVNHLTREDRETFSSLRVLTTGGDVLLARACRDIAHSKFAGEFYNLYGPTEATTACTAHRIDTELDIDGSVPIGLPLQGAYVRLLNDDLEEVPEGLPGQIFVGGVGVARGYLGPEELSSARFITDPFDVSLGSLYATGDLARKRPDGTLEFLGRSDDQGKVRGYRVEPFEVDEVLRTNPMVEDAVVLLHGEGDGRQLAAFLILTRGTTTSAVRSYLEERLPDYLVPAMLLTMEQLPTTENGKRDIAALRSTIQEELKRRSGYCPPDTDTERYLAGLFEELLCVEQVGSNDDFFSLGGHSLMAFRMHRRISRDTGRKLDFQDVLQHPRVSELAAVLDREVANA